MYFCSPPYVLEADLERQWCHASTAEVGTEHAWTSLENGKVLVRLFSLLIAILLRFRRRLIYLLTNK